MAEAVLEKPAESEEPTDEETKGSAEGGGEMKGLMSLLTPEGLIFMPLAITLDLIGIIWFILDFFYGIGEIPSYITDAFGMIFFGTWIIIRSQFQGAQGTTYGEMTEQVGAAKEERKKAVQLIKTKGKEGVKAAKAGRRVFFRFLIAAIGELLPILGNILPMWTWFVYSELKK